MKYLKNIILVLSIFGCTFFLNAQHIIEGRIIAEDLEPLPYVDVFAASNSLTDGEGYFQIAVSPSLDSLTFALIGFETITVPIKESCNNIEVILMPDVLYHNISNRKIDKLRKKRFDKLSELHEVAAQKGIFKKVQPCYPREFKPQKPDLDKIKQEMKAERKAIKNYFKNLKIGDTISVPFSGTYKYDGTDRTTLHHFSSVVDGNKFDCIIRGILLEKNKGINKYNLKYKITSLEKCSYNNILHNDKEIRLGDVLEYNMKYFKIIKE